MINMITNELPFGRLSEDARKRFRTEGKKGNVEIFDGKIWRQGVCQSQLACRLKLKDKTLCYVGSYGLAEYRADRKAFFSDDNNEICSVSEAQKLSRVIALTQAEIDSVKPSFKRGDVVVSDEFEYDLGNKKGYILYRFKRECIEDEDGDKQHDVESLISASGDFSFNTDCGANDKPHLATPDQIKQLERQEMKHGKKWNGEGYDDWLTADGLTINEIIKHGIENIQVGGEKHDTEWRRTSHTYLDSVINEMLVFVKDYRLKPQESFVDVEIDWSYKLTPRFYVGQLGLVDTLKTYKKAVKNMSIEDKFVLSKFKYELNEFNDNPFITSADGSEFVMKATHARFVKVG